MPRQKFDLQADANPTQATRAVKTRWFPVRSELTVFMQQRVDCPACRMMRLTAGRTVTPLYHVRRFGGSLIITEADDLHRPGRYLAATCVSDDHDGAIFRLLDMPQNGIDSARFRPGQGMAVMSKRHGRFTLSVSGTAAGFVAHDGVLIEAVEVGA